jgi:hypothetical protein
VVKSPPAYTVWPSALIESTLTEPLTSWLNEVISAPVLALKAARWLRATSPDPAAAPGGRTLVKSPPR